MTAVADTLTRRLDALEATLGRPSRFVLAFSGGLDSTVLLHALATAGRDVPLLAVHVNHQLQSPAAEWAETAREAALALGVDCRVERVEPDRSAGKGLEAAAREARYAALSALLEPGDWLLSAHHADDQVETLFLNLLRGSGPDGLAAMPESRRLGAGWLVRPLLAVTRDELAGYAARFELDWVDDPSNAERDFDRNYLRHEVLPRIAERWPDSLKRLTRSIERQQDASALLAEIGNADVALSAAPDRLDVTGLLGLSAVRRRNALRAAIRLSGLGAPPAAVLEAIDTDLLPARVDGAPHVAWPGGEARRYRGTLYLMPMLAPPPRDALPFDRDSLALPGGLGTLVLERGDGPGLAPALVAGGLTVRWREGGERLRLAAEGPTRPLKKLLQEASIVPWMRERLPLVYAGDTLVAVADRYMAAEATATPGVRIRWLDHPDAD